MLLQIPNEYQESGRNQTRILDGREKLSSWAQLAAKKTNLVFIVVLVRQSTTLCGSRSFLLLQPNFPLSSGCCFIPPSLVGGRHDFMLLNKFLRCWRKVEINQHSEGYSTYWMEAKEGLQLSGGGGTDVAVGEVLSLFTLSLLPHTSAFTCCAAARMASSLVNGWRLTCTDWLTDWWTDKDRILLGGREENGILVPPPILQIVQNDVGKFQDATLSLSLSGTVSTVN